MVKILFVVNSLAIGGVEKALVNLANSLDKDKYDITLLCIVKDFKLKEQLNRNIKLKGIFPNGMKGIDHIFKFVPANILYKLFVREKFDVEVAYADGKPVVLLGLNTVSKVKKYTWIHQDLKKYDKVINCYRSWEEYRDSYKNFDEVFCVSEEINKNFDEVVHTGNSSVMYNIIPKEEITLKSLEPIEMHKEYALTLAIVGRLSNEKGQLRLLKIHKQLMNEGFHHNLWIIGDGPEKLDLMEYIQLNNLQKSVQMAGVQSNPYKYVAKSDLYICPSYTEALSTTCIESLLLGVPVISTDVPGSQDILGNNNCGIIVDNTEESLYLGLKNILENPTILEEYRANMQLPQHKFNDENIIKTLDELWIGNYNGKS